MKLLIAILTIILLLLQYRVWFGDGSYLEHQALQTQIDALSERNAELASNNALLASEVEAIRSGGQPLEAIARSELGMIRPGETLVLIISERDFQYEPR
jgi:cell division protein FtsB